MIRRSLFVSTTAILALLLSSSATLAQKFEVTPVAEKKVSQLPAGPLFWRIDNFSTLAQAKDAAGSTALAAEVAGKVWLFTLGPPGGSSSGGSKVAEIGPVAPITAARINSAGGPPGAETPVHTHPGVRNLLRADRRTQSKDPARREPCPCWPVYARTWTRYADASVQQRCERSAGSGDVCRGCHQAVLVASDHALRRACPLRVA